MFILLAGCGDEIIPPDIKRQDPVVFKGDFEFTKYKGTLDEIVPGNELLLVGGELVKNRHETVIGDFGVKVHRVYRGDAAKYRLPKEVREDKLKKGQEWVMVELDVFNYEMNEGELGFGEGEIGLYTKKGKKIKDYKINLDSSPENIAVYEGEEKRIKVVAVVKKKTKKLLLGVDKIVEEFRLEDLDENGKLIEREEEVEFEEIDTEDEDTENKKEKEKKGKKKDKKKEEDEESKIKYISLEEIPVIDVFYEDEEEEQDDIDKQQEDMDKEEEDKKRKSKKKKE